VAIDVEKPHGIIPEPMIPSFHCSIIPIAERSGAKFHIGPLNRRYSNYRVGLDMQSAMVVSKMIIAFKK
jgi:hypothetical protein